MKRSLALVCLGMALGYAGGVATRAVMADSTYLEADIGVAKGHTAPDGIWWESQFPTENKVTSRTYQVGLSHVFDNRIGIRGDFTDLQHSSTNNVAIPNENAVAARLAGAVTCANGVQFCLAKWNGRGSVRGVHLGAFYDFQPGGFQVQPEAGVFAYRYQFSMQLAPLENGAPNGFVSSESGTGAGNFWTEYARLTVAKSWFFARADFNYNVKGRGGVVGIQEGSVMAGMIGVRVPL